MDFIKKFDGENIDGQHLRPPVLAILPVLDKDRKISGLLFSFYTLIVYSIDNICMSKFGLVSQMLKLAQNV